MSLAFCDGRQHHTELRVRISEPAGMDRALELVRGLAQQVVASPV
jgi:hypothetical protein